MRQTYLMEQEKAMAQTPELAVAMDWGGTWARASVADRNGVLLWSDRVRNAPGASKDQLIEDAERLLHQAIERCQDRPIAGVGVAVAGPVDADSGTLYQPPNLPLLDGVSLKQEWEPRLGYPVLVGNDANLAALGELNFGAGRDARHDGQLPTTLVYVTVSTGVGGGVVDRGRLLLGAHGLAGEVGHMTIDYTDHAPLCLCGNTGCLETLTSGTAIARIARERVAKAGMDSVLGSRDAQSITAEAVFEAADQGDRLAQSVLDGVVKALSVGLTNLLHLFNPDLVVLGGGVTEGLTRPGLLGRINLAMLERAMSQRHRDFLLVPSKLGDSAGMVGAASLVWEEAWLLQDPG
jgi:glucokinase